LLKKNENLPDLSLSNKMPLTSNVSKNIAELYRDNKKKGKARGANGKVRSRAQIIAIAYHEAHKK
jgi:hypothetical protein